MVREEVGQGSKAGETMCGYGFGKGHWTFLWICKSSHSLKSFRLTSRLTVTGSRRERRVTLISETGLVLMSWRCSSSVTRRWIEVIVPRWATDWDTHREMGCSVTQKGLKEMGSLNGNGWSSRTEENWVWRTTKVTWFISAPTVGDWRHSLYH